MSRETITKLEADLNKVLRCYETEFEVTTAEMCGVLGILKTDRELKAILPHCADFLKNILEISVTSEGGAPVGKILTLEGKEGDTHME